MAKPNTFYARYALIILMAFFFAAPLVIQSAQRAIKSNKNRVQDWLPNTFRETTELRWFRKHFVADQFVLISWDGCTLGGNPALPDSAPDDPRIEKLARLLEPSAENPGGYKGMFQKATTARRLIDDLTSRPSEVPYTEALKRFQGTMIGPDGKQTCVVAMLSDAAIKDFRAVLGKHVANGSLPWQRKPGILWDALAECGIDKNTVRLGGPPVENVAIDEEGGRTLARLGTLSLLLGLVLAYWSLRNVILTLIVFTCGILSAAAGLAVVFWTGSTTDAVLMSMPSMTYVLAISGAVHLVNYYRAAIKEHGLVGAPERAIAHGWKPALLCSVTNAIGVGSLYVSDLEPIRKFGFYSAISMMMMLIMLFLFLPAALTMWPARAWERKRLQQKKDDRKVDLAAGTIWSEALWGTISSFLVRHHAVVATACILFIIAMGFGVTRLKTQIDLLKLFDSQARVRKDYAWLEQNVGRLVPLEVVVRFPPHMMRPEGETVEAEELPESLSFLERLETVSLVQQIIDQELGPNGNDLVGPTIAAATFAPNVQDGQRDLFAVARRNVTNEQLEASHRNLSKSGYLTTDHDNGAELWRISLRAAAFRGLDYGLFVESVRQVIEPVLAAQRLRQTVLARLIEQRGDNSLAGAKICLWDQGGPPKPKEENREKTQQELYIEAASGLLLKARLKVTHTVVDLATLPEASRDQLFGKLKTFDTVVLTGSFTDAQVREIEQAGIRVTDARTVLANQIADSHNPAAELNHVAALYTGVVPIVYKAQRALLENLMESSFYSFITITPLLMLVSWSVAGGAVAMMPNALPILCVFGGMGWLGIPVDIGSMMSASIALGVAVDDTIHFLTWYREALARADGDRPTAIKATYRHCAPPTLQAACISGLGLSVFMFSSFTPTQRMGWLMMIILFAGVVAELVMLPAILAGPLGKAFTLGKNFRREDLIDDDSDEEEPLDDEAKQESEARPAPRKAQPAYVGGNGSHASGHTHAATNGDSHLPDDQPHPHAWTLRERLAQIRRTARE